MHVAFFDYFDVAFSLIFPFFVISISLILPSAPGIRRMTFIVGDDWQNMSRWCRRRQHSARREGAFRCRSLSPLSPRAGHSGLSDAQEHDDLQADS